jgi:arginase
MKKIKILGVPMDLGADRRGVDMGPSAMRIAGLRPRLHALGYEVEDLGNISVAIPEVLRVVDKRAKYLPEVAHASRELARRVQAIVADGAIPLVLGGDQSVSIGTIAGVASHYRQCGQRIGVIWFDAHADMNTPETTPSGNIHGMPYAISLGMGPSELTEIEGFSPKLDPSVCALIGPRTIDPLERENVRRSGIKVFTMRELDELGMREVMRQAIEIATRDTVGFHVSVDMDFFDPTYAPGVGTPERGGATYREGHLAMELIADTKKIVSLEIVEVNPVLDQRNCTAEFAVELVLSAFGKRIL